MIANQKANVMSIYDAWETAAELAEKSWLCKRNKDSIGRTKL